jgi:hypothetical protein
MPHTGTKYTQQDYNDTIQQLKNVLDKCPIKAIPIIGGDFNATIGTDQSQDNQPVTGKYKNKERSKNGMQLREFMALNNLTSSATHFQTANHNTWSWQGNGTNKKQINHIITKRTELKRFINVEKTGGVLSDHKAIIATIQIAKRVPKKRKQEKMRERTKKKPIKPTKKNQTKNRLEFNSQRTTKIQRTAKQTINREQKL